MTRRPARIRFVFVAAAMAALIAPAALAQPGSAPAPPPDATSERRVQTVAVEVDGTRLFRVQGINALPAQERADAITGRIVDLADDASVPVQALRIQETPFSSQIVAGSRLVMNVVDADAVSEGTPRQLLAAIYLGRVKDAVARYRADREGPAMEWAALWTVGATAVLVALLVGVRWLFRRLDGLLESRYRHRAEALAAKSRELLSASRLLTSLRSTLRILRVVASLVVVLLYARWVLERFPQTRAVARHLTGFIVDPLTTMWSGFVAWLPDLFFLLVLFAVGRIVLRLLRRFFDAVADGRIRIANFDPDWAAPTYRLVRPVIIIFGLVVGYPYIPGSGSDAFKGVSIFLGVMFSLGSTSFIANLIAGHTVIYRRAFRVGDVVQVGDVLGAVTAIRLQATHVRTFKNEEVAVPNSQILSSPVTNYSALAKTSGVILHTIAGIGYETPWRQVEAMLLEAAGRTPGVKADPPPFVLQLKLDDFCVQYELNVHCSEPLLILETYTELHRNVLDVFNEYGVQIMTPAYMHDPTSPKVVPRDQWYLAPARPPGTDGPALPRPRGAAFT
jgi:small-conductance mechanosensitive channel